MREQVDRLQKLTTDLLDLSRLDAGSLDLELEPVPLRTLANQVAGEFAAAAARKDVRDRGRRPRVPSSTSRRSATRERVAQIVRVLIDNALVHTPEGTRITIAAGRGPSAGSPETAQLLVTDDGPGIRRRDLPHVFDRFHTGDSASGSGLGLAIARELAQRMQGGLEVDVPARAAPSSRSRCRSPASAERAAERAPRRHARRGGRVRRRARSRCWPRSRSPAVALAGCGGGDDDSDGGTSTVERTRVQVVEGLGGKNGFDPADDLRPPLARRRDGHVAVLEVGQPRGRPRGRRRRARAAASCSTTTATSPPTRT